MCYVGKCRLEKSHWTFVKTADVRVHTTYKKTFFSLMVFKTFLFILLAVDSLKKIIKSSLNECTVCTVVCVCDGPPNELWSLCVDDGDPPKTATATLTVTVEDINDNAPRFLKDYRPVLPEHSAPRKVSIVAPLFWCIKFGSRILHIPTKKYTWLWIWSCIRLLLRWSNSGFES